MGGTDPLLALARASGYAPHPCQVGRFLLTRHELREVIGSAGEWSVYLQARTAIRALVGAAGAVAGAKRGALTGAVGAIVVAALEWWLAK